MYTPYLFVSLDHQFNHPSQNLTQRHHVFSTSKPTRVFPYPRSFPQRNGDVFAFTPELNEVFMHGVPHVMPNSPAAMEPEDAWLLAAGDPVDGNPEIRHSPVDNWLEINYNCR